jgi:hypothetical protein
VVFALLLAAVIQMARITLGEDRPERRRPGERPA